MKHTLEAQNGLILELQAGKHPILILPNGDEEVLTPKDLRQLSADVIELIDTPAFRSFEQKALPKKKAGRPKGKRGPGSTQAASTTSTSHAGESATPKPARGRKRGSTASPEHQEPPVNAEMAHPTADSRPHGPAEPEQPVSETPSEKPIKTKVRHAKPKPTGPRVAEE